MSAERVGVDGDPPEAVPVVRRPVDRGAVTGGLRVFPSRRTAARALLRPILSVVAVLVLYYLLPLDRGFTWRTVGWLLGGLGVLGFLAAWQVRSVMRASRPALRAVETLAFTVPVFLLLFASVYVLLDASRPGQFTQPMTRTDALYFVVVVFSTVGFGDITPVSEVARTLTTVQIVTDLLLLGTVFRAMASAVQHRRGGLALRMDGDDEPVDP